MDPVHNGHPTPARHSLLAWAAALAAGLGLTLARKSQAILPQGVAPLGNDAFYHGARIKAIAADPSSLYEFDALLHWPDGMMLAWPWAYDYLLGAIAGLVARNDDAVMHLVAFSPALWLLGSITCLAVIGRRLLGPALLFALLLAFAASPPTVLLHAVGAIDHHAAEMFFMLAALALLMRWMQRPAAAGAAIALGAVLGVASAFHNGLFMLQIPVLITLFLARFRMDSAPPRGAALAFGVALVAAQLLALLPSTHFAQLDYAFYHLSWFHLHVAVLSALAVLAMSLSTRRAAGIALALACLGVLPAIPQVLEGLAFMGSTTPLLGDMLETHSPYTVPRNFSDVTMFYTALIWIAPLLALYALASLLRGEHARWELAAWVFALLGLSLLMLQVRFFQFGVAFLFLVPLLFFQGLALDERRRSLYAGLFLVAAFVLSLPWYTHLGAPGLSPRWASGWPLLRDLEVACEAEPGLVLAHQNWGNLVRYETRCPVIANNFILTANDVAAIRRSHELLAMEPAQLRASLPDMRYVLVSRMDQNPLTRHLMSEQHYRGFEVVVETRNARGDLLGRLYRVAPP